MTTLPGWYPDPAGQRYHDGRRWTQHFTPTPPAVEVPTAVAVAGSGATVRAARRRPLIALEVFGGLVLIDSVAQHPWLLAVFAVIAVLAGAGFWALKAAQRREEEQRREQFQRDLLAQRAEHEDKLYQQGDPRGVHGQHLPPECG